MCKNSVRWLYRLEEDFTWPSKHATGTRLLFRDKKGVVRLILEPDGRITVTKGYAWNGCSPKVCFWDFLVGTPEGVVHAVTEKRKTYFASLLHDALYQFIPDGLPLKRRHADRIFRDLLRESDFAPWLPYWLAVYAFGWIVMRSTRVKRQTSGTREAETV
jgi:hypothetical protein